MYVYEYMYIHIYIYIYIYVYMFNAATVSWWSVLANSTFGCGQMGSTLMGPLQE